MDNLEELETLRKEFMAYFKKLKIINTITLFISFIIFICDVVFLRKYGYWMFVVAFALIIVMFILVKCIKKSVASKTQKYIKSYYNKTSTTLLNNANINEITFLTEDTLNIDDVKEARIMEEVVFARSRNNLSFNLNNKEQKMADLVFKINNSKDNKNPIVAFCGKFLKCQSEKCYDGRTLIYRKTTVPNCYGPTDIKGLDKIIDDDKLLVYSSNKNFKKVITKDLLDKIRSIEINDNLFDMTISLYDNSAVILLSYADKIMVVPSYDPVPFEALDKVKKDLNVVINDILKNL